MVIFRKFKLEKKNSLEKYVAASVVRVKNTLILLLYTNPPVLFKQIFP